MPYLSNAKRRWLQVLAVVLPLMPFAPSSHAQEKPYFVTYSHDLEEPGNLDLETKTALAQPGGSTRYGATALEFEYGVRAWWTSELYLDGQATAQDSTIFTGFRIENRVRPLMRDYIINPVLYVEYENTSGADKTILEVVGHDSQSDLAEPNGESRREHQHEAELKLILSSNVRDWNISENFISEKNLGHDPWEFGYAIGAARPLRGAAASRSCTFCADKFIAGAEAYGGLGDRIAHPPRYLPLHRATHRMATPQGPPRQLLSRLRPHNIKPRACLSRSASPMSSARSATGSTPPTEVAMKHSHCKSLSLSHFVFCAALAFAAANPSCSGPVPAKDRARAQPLRRQTEMPSPPAKPLYADHCAECHEPDARGKGTRPCLRTEPSKAPPTATLPGC